MEKRIDTNVIAIAAIVITGLICLTVMFRTVLKKV